MPRKNILPLAGKPLIAWTIEAALGSRLDRVVVSTDDAEIEDYLLLLRTVDDEFEESLYVEVNEQQFGGHDLLESAELVSNTLTLNLREPSPELGGARKIVLTFAESAENLAAIEAGLFRVLGDVLDAGHA